MFQKVNINYKKTQISIIDLYVVSQNFALIM